MPEGAGRRSVAFTGKKACGDQRLLKAGDGLSGGFSLAVTVKRRENQAGLDGDGAIGLRTRERLQNRLRGNPGVHVERLG